MSNNFRSDVYSREIDLSQVVRIISNTYAILVGPTAEGPVEPTFVSDFEQWTTLYGRPDAKFGMSGYSAMAFFEQGGGCWFKRVVSEDATYGGLLVKNDGSGSDRNVSIATVNFDNLDLIDFETFDGADESDDNLFTIFPLGPGSYSSNLAVEITSENITTPANVTANVATGLRSGKLPVGDHKYRVSAFNRTGETVASNEIVATVANEGQLVRVQLDGQTGAAGYRVYRQLDGETEFSLIARLSTIEIEWEDYGIEQAVEGTPKETGENTNEDTPEFTISVFDNRVSKGIPRETFIVSLEERTNSANVQTELTEVINGNSQYIQVISNVENLLGDLPVIYSQERKIFATGDEGSIITASEMILAARIFEDKEAYPAALFLSGGYTSPSFQKEITRISESRQDIIALLDIPSNRQGATNAIDFRSLELGINSNYAGLFCNDNYLFDPFKNVEVAVPASAIAAARLAFTDQVANPAFSPAGFRRGRALTTLRLREKYSRADKDRMAFSGINYFDSERSYGVTLRESYTLQTDYSALSYIPVRRIINVAEQSTETALKIFLQEPNDDIVESQLLALLRDFYQIMKDRRMISRFEVYGKTSPEEIALGNRNIYTLIEPLIPVVRINHTTVITKQGAVFSQVIEQLDPNAI